MKNRFKTAFVVIGSLIYSALSVAQSQTSPGLKSFTPPTPNASALGKYGEIPVSLYTGIPNISVPLYTIKSRDLELPISLSYHAGGIRVEEVASWVGLGFSLNAGGVITRSLRGLADDAQNGYFNIRASISALGEKYLNSSTPTTSYGTGQGNGLTEDVSTFDQIMSQLKDSESDIFHFNFGRYSGKFFMNSTGDFVSIPVQAMKIEYQTNTYGVMRWQITMPDGVKFIFGSTLESTPVRTAIESNQTGGPNDNAATAWYLLEIISPNKDKIDLTYTPEEYDYDTKPSEVINLFLESNPSDYRDGTPAFDNRVVRNYFKGVRLDNIKFANGEIKFNASTSRQDVMNSNYLEGIEIRDLQSTILKRYNFFFGYFDSNGDCPTQPITRSYCKRLRLDRVEEISGDNSTAGGKYSFNYNSTQLPSWDPNSTKINSQDLWGYYNGANNPKLPRSFKITLQSGPVTLSGADRHSDQNAMLACALTQITYPTGGYTIFDYESNKLNASDDELGYSASAPVSKSDYLQFQSGETKTKIISIREPDPLTGTAVVTFHNRQQVYETDFTKNPSRPKCAPDPNTGLPTCFESYIEGANGTIFSRQYLIENTSTLNLPPGDYKISGTSLSGYEQFEQVTTPKIYYLQLYWTEYPQTTSPIAQTDKTVGGLRIARITNSSNGQNTVKKYLYSKFNDNISSAKIVNYPSAHANVYTNVELVPDPVSGLTITKTVTYAQVRSTTLVPLIPSQGSVLGYANVTELDGENGENGKTEYTFTTAVDYPDEIKNYRPYPQSCSFDWRRGLLLKKSIYSNNQTTPVLTIENSYLFNKSPHLNYGLSIEKDFYGDAGGAANYYVGGYKTASEFFYQQTEKTQTYSPSGGTNFLEVVKTYEYGWPQGHYQLTKSSVVDSQGVLTETENKYPGDLILTGEAETARQALVNNFIIGPVLEQTTLKNQVQLSKIKTNYKVFPDGLINISGIDQMIGSGPLERRVNFSKYDSYGNVLQQSKENDSNNSYVWDYNNAYPIAQVVNAISDDVAYTSFESNGSGNWSIPSSVRNSTDFRAGNRSYLLTNGAISKTSLINGRKYSISFWKKTGTVSLNGTAITPTSIVINGWQYCETSITGSLTITTATISGTALIDEVRLYPAEAQMLTNTIDPLKGLTSQTDANNQTTFFEYDLLGRLAVVKDSQGKILKTYKYNYKQ